MVTEQATVIVKFFNLIMPVITVIGAVFLNKFIKSSAEKDAGKIAAMTLLDKVELHSESENLTSERKSLTKRIKYECYAILNERDFRLDTINLFQKTANAAAAIKMFNKYAYALEHDINAEKITIKKRGPLLPFSWLVVSGCAALALSSSLFVVVGRIDVEHINLSGWAPIVMNTIYASTFLVFAFQLFSRAFDYCLSKASLQRKLDEVMSEEIENRIIS